MPTYTYRCPRHGDFDIQRSFAEFGRETIYCGTCLREGDTEECIHVLHAPSIIKSSLRHEATFDSSLGVVVTGQQDREEKAKRIGEKEGRNIVFVDPTDTKALGVSDEGLDATRRRKQDTGEAEGTKHFV